MAGYATRRAGGAGVAGGNHICRDQQVCVTLRWREKDSNLWYRGTKAVRGIAGVTGRGPRLLVDGTPETHPLAGDPSNHFVQVPSSARAGRPPAIAVRSATPNFTTQLRSCRARSGVGRREIQTAC